MQSPGTQSEDSKSRSNRRSIAGEFASSIRSRNERSWYQRRQERGAAWQETQARALQRHVGGGQNNNNNDDDNDSLTTHVSADEGKKDNDNKSFVGKSKGMGKGMNKNKDKGKSKQSITENDFPDDDDKSFDGKGMNMSKKDDDDKSFDGKGKHDIHQFLFTESDFPEIGKGMGKGMSKSKNGKGEIGKGEIGKSMNHDENGKGEIGKIMNQGMNKGKGSGESSSAAVPADFMAHDFGNLLEKRFNEIANHVPQMGGCPHRFADECSAAYDSD